MIRLALITALLLLVAGCDSGSPNEENPARGTFEATVVYDATTETFEGFSSFASEEDGEGFIFGFLGDDRTKRITLNRALAARPGTGMHAIVEYLDAETADTDFWGTSTVGSYALSESGTLTITSSSAEEIAGTFEFTATGEFGTGEETVTVSATFHAICRPGVGQDCG